MAVSTFFNNFGNSQEQELLEDLVIESIRIYGQDMLYLPRTRTNFDQLYYEDDRSSYDYAYPVEIYIKSVEGFGGQAAFMSKFGLEIRDEVVFSIARRTFANDVTREQVEVIRPREGDLIFFPLNQKLFQIKLVDNKPFFYQLGELQMFDMTCELFEYSNEIFTTGIPEIDSIQKNYSIDALDFAIITQNADQLITSNSDYLITQQQNLKQAEYDPTADNNEIDSKISADNIVDWTESNPFAEGQY